MTRRADLQRPGTAGPARTGLAAGLAGVLVAGLVLAGCSSPSVEDVVQDDEGFADCVEATGASAEGSGDWDGAEARAFWSEPGTLDCAVDELDDDQRSDALATAFPDPEDAEESAEESLDAQRAVLAGWAARSTAERSLDETVERAEALLVATWVAGSDDVASANGLAGPVVLAAMLEAGELESYRDYLERTGETDSPFLALRRIEEGTDEERRRYRDLLDPLVDAVLGG